MVIDRKKAGEMRARFFPKPTTCAEERAMAVNVTAAREGNADPALDILPDLTGVSLPGGKSEPAKKVVRQESKIKESD